MTNIQSQLKARIMRRIYFIYYCRRAIGIFALKIYFAILLIAGLLYNVSILDVFSNAIHIAGDSGIKQIPYYSKYALMNTELMVQAIFVLTILFGGIFLTSTLKGTFFRNKAHQA